MIEKHYKTLKSIRKNTLFTDYYFMGKYSVSPYMACEHACKYCDGRAEKYYVEGNFEKDIVIRENIPELLAKKLPTFRESGTILIGSGVSDPYQPIEEKEGLMRKSLSVIAENNFPVSIMTKSNLILRDLDLIDEINKKSRSTLMVSITFPDDQHRKIFEPYASSIDERLEVIRLFKERDIPVQVLAMPLLPGISDSTQSVKKLFTLLKNLGVDAIMPGGLTLRPGRQKEVYFEVIKKHYPNLLELYKNIYRKDHPSGSGDNAYFSQTMSPVYSHLKALEIPYFLPHYVYKVIFPKYDEIYFLIKHMKKLFQYKGIDITNLTYADDNYNKWYLENKKLFNKKRSTTQASLEALLMSELSKPIPSVLAGNKKLANFMLSAVYGEEVFNYITLKLE